MLKKIIKLPLLLTIILFSICLYATPIQIVTAENFYGDIAKQIGGKNVIVTAIMNRINQDPHLFSSSPTTARLLAKADLIVYNGLGYDTWIDNLIKSNVHPPKQIVVGDLLGEKMGNNPHIWYNPRMASLYAKQLVDDLSKLDPTHSADYQQNWQIVNQHNSALAATIAHLKRQYQHVPIIATEPIFNDMADALDLTMYGNAFQLSMMNETEPSVSAIEDFETKLNTHAVKILIYNNQVTNPITERMKELAKKADIAIVGVSEMQPATMDYWSWMQTQLSTLETALAKAS